jgi:uncharacterized protein (TIGR02246 family)
VRVNIKFLRCAILLTVVLAGPILRAGQNPDETEIRKVELGLQEAWNHHDMKAWASLFTEDADFVNVAGWWWKGRAEIEKKHTEIHAYIFRDSTLTIYEVDTRFLAPEIAVVHISWSLTGNRNPDGSDGQPRKGIFTQVLQKQNGRWLIAAAQNTDSRPEMPMPAGPPKK